MRMRKEGIRFSENIFLKNNKLNRMLTWHFQRVGSTFLKVVARCAPTSVIPAHEMFRQMDH